MRIIPGTGLLSGAVLMLSAPAMADESSAESEASETIIVTARQRPEDAQDVPAALSVVGDRWLEQSYTLNTRDLTTLVPALNYSSANPRNTAFTIRGLGSSVVAVSQANDGLEPGVGYYVDGVYHARPATAAFDFSDIERIEVLRGPQGTLFGKNTTAGAINIISAAPSFTPGVNAELSVGERQFVQTRVSATGPLAGHKLAYRLSGTLTRRDGLLRNIVNGRDQNTLGTQAVRGQVLWQPSADFKFRLIADFANFDSECCTQVYLRVGTSLRAAARQFPALAAAAGYTPASTNPYDRLTDIDAPLAVKTSEGGIAGTADWNIGAATVTSISAWRFWNWDAANDRDFTSLPIQLIQRIPSRQDQLSQELRIASNGDRDFTYVSGLYFFRQVLTGHPTSVFGPYGAPWLIGATTGANATPVPANLLDGYGQTGDTRFAVNSYAAFGEANWRILPRLTLTGGLRYTYEVKEGDFSTQVFGGPTTTSTALNNARLGVLRPQTYSARDSEGSLSGRANIAWQPVEDVLLYASVARGFKSGGINMSGLPLDANNQPALSTAVVEPERNTTWEAGIKSTLWDNRLTLNLAAYHTTVSDFQATVVDSSQTVALRGYLSNIPEVRVQGIEADAALRIGRLTLIGALAYSDGTYTDYPAGPCPLEVQTAATAACDLSGHRFAGLPRWSETLSADYTVPVADGALFFHADSNWRSGYFGDPSLSRFTFIDGYNLTNASLGYRRENADGEGWEIAVFARNLFDADYIQNVTIQAGNSGLILGTPSDPRTAGVTFRLRR
ncbi:iron complex outermembrane receptor protein [Blastomonas natatoria]|uniref:Iron complex outermembrane receptor protein n=2 Tax=Blastomonas natatoria TaxID=34015 RepID=A0A2V3UVS2_9SPHN|nr:iron complex outermembrane receptor protein [Blastomonas natatoria]